MLAIIFFILLFLASFLPHWWASYTFKRYAKNKSNIKGSGGQLAKHLIKRFGLDDVVVEITKQGDHYNLEDKKVCLSADNYHHHSLTAIAVAAHEVGHAIQHHQNEKKLYLRTTLIKKTFYIEKLGSLCFYLMPLLFLISHNPILSFIFFAIAISSLLASTAVHLITLPVEWDASFSKALPILSSGYIDQADVGAVKQILQAAALTYIAASLISLFNIWRWLKIFK